MQAPTRRRGKVGVDGGSGSLESQSEIHLESILEPTHDSTPNTSLRDFSLEVFLAFVFWTVFAESVAALWYIPMNLMHLSGVEPIFFVYLLPFLLKYHAVRDMIYSYPLFNIATSFGLLVLHSTHLWIYGTCIFLFGALQFVVVLANLMHPDQSRRERYIHSLLLGLFALVAVRFGLSSVSPLLLYNAPNLIAAAFCIIASIILHLNRNNPSSIYHPSFSQKYYTSKSDLSFHAHSQTSSSLISGPTQDALVGIGFGGFMTLVVVFCSEHGMIARWTATHPFPFGIAMMTSFVCGMFMSHHPFVKTWAWWSIALVSTLLFFTLQNSFGALCGCVLIIYLTSIFHIISDELSRLVSIARPMLLMGFVYAVGCLGTVWCIAYNFVPGGFFVREMTPHMVILFLCFTKLAYKAYPLSVASGSGFMPSSKSSSSKSSASSSGPTSLSSTSSLNHHQNMFFTSNANQKLFLVSLAVIFLVIFIPAFVKRGISYHNYDSNGLDTSNVRAMVWATHFGYDNFGRPSYDDMLSLIEKSTSNVIGLVETDIMRLFNGNRDIVEWLEEKLHMYAEYGPSTGNHTWGCALLSAFPIKRADNYVLPSPDGENACLIDATLDVNGKELEVIVVHFGNTEHVRDRHLQTEDTYNRLKEKIDAGKRVIWIGYFTSAPGSENYNRVMSTGVIDTTNDKDRYCEYIWYKNMKLSKFRRIAQGHVSDTEIQYAEFAPFSDASIDSKGTTTHENLKQDPKRASKVNSHDIRD